MTICHETYWELTCIISILCCHSALLLYLHAYYIFCLLYIDHRQDMSIIAENIRKNPRGPHNLMRTQVSIVGSLRDREVAYSASDRQGSNFESCVWRTVSSQSSHHPQEVLLAQFSLYVQNGGLKPDSFHLCAHMLITRPWFMHDTRNAFLMIQIACTLFHIYNYVCEYIFRDID